MSKHTPSNETYANESTMAYVTTTTRNKSRQRHFVPTTEFNKSRFISRVKSTLRFRIHDFVIFHLPIPWKRYANQRFILTVIGLQLKSRERQMGQRGGSKLNVSIGSTILNPTCVVLLRDLSSVLIEGPVSAAIK